MSRPLRRLTMQLTPLLDLLLIVIFAQFLEVRETDAQRARAAARREREFQAAQEETLRLQAALGDAFRLLAEARRAMQSSQELIRRGREELQQHEQDLERSQQRQEVLGRLLVELFRVPQPVIDELLDPHRVPPLSESAEEFERLRKEFQRLAEASPGAAIRHLLTFEEVRKHCDFWELHLERDSRRLALVDAQRQQHFLALPLEDAQPAASLDRVAFERELYAMFKSWPQPKSLVLVLFSYDAGVRINVRDPAQEGILRVLDRLRVGAAGRTRFEFADFGIPLP